MGSLPKAEVIRVLIAGGCYAGLSTALNLCDLMDGLSPRMSRGLVEGSTDAPKLDIQITIVDERDGFFHVIGSPLALADAEYAKKAWVKFSDIPALLRPNIRIIQGSVMTVDCDNKSATIQDNIIKETTTHGYDYFVAATGLRRVWPVVPQSLTRKQYLLEAEEHIHAVANSPEGVVVVGGGAVGIEMAAELKLVKPHVKVTLVHSRDKLLSSEDLSDECKDRALDLLRESGVEVLMGHRLAETKELDTVSGRKRYEVEFTNGHKILANEVIMAISKSVPTTSYLPTSALDAEGYVKILPNLSFDSASPNASSHFCGGDAARWSGIKRCGAAMHHGFCIGNNIHQSIVRDLTGQAPKFQEMGEVAPMIGLAVGKKAVASGPEGTVYGEDVMQSYFRDDLGFTICWDWMQLGGRKEALAA
ncbi:putative pyridine nucleotide-disulfide oxidoreductase AMID-like protein [Stachybotrys elegans]|uniref:Pyridine nucleotide-disulfide oxidoreductase AMID-like protein n=1 Tax=Stachybotrys elegans TaxID=80388 RepID=A0A8K0SMJ1_9HYPO|nr:putative pyridine nucleotide-disulfide oxidoreductase AMID-like protein [Stachybotrys elegans]